MTVLKRVHDVKHHVGAANHVENLSTAAFPFGRTFDQTGQVENLYFGAAVLHHAGNACQGREGITPGLGVSVGHLGDKGGFSNRWKADKGNRGITRFSDLKPFASAAGF